MDLIQIFLFIAGTCVGSFLNVCIYRIPIGKSIISPSSYCPNCKTKLKWYQNIPIVSYFLLQGKCYYCGKKISILYPFIEIITGLLFLFNYKIYGFSFEYFSYTLFELLLILVFFIDAKHMIIPDEISIGGTIAGFLLSFLNKNISWLDSLLGILIGGGILYGIILVYYILTKKHGMGGGDIKLLAMIGAFLGVKSLFFVIFVSSLIGTIISLPIIFLLKKENKKNIAIPFGPFLSISAIIYLYWGKYIINLYITKILQ